MSRSKSRRRLRPIVTAAVALLVFASVADVWLSAASGDQRHGEPPNIVFVLTDDLSWNLVRYMPHVLAMERAGATFSKYFVTDSLCCPSRTSIMTGLLPHDSGVFNNSGGDGGFSAFQRHDDEHRTFAGRVAARRLSHRDDGQVSERIRARLPGRLVRTAGLDRLGRDGQRLLRVRLRPQPGSPPRALRPVPARTSRTSSPVWPRPRSRAGRVDR